MSPIAVPAAAPVAAPSGVGIGTTLSAFRTGRFDPTTRLDRRGDGGQFWRATLTPDGPGTLRIRWNGDRVHADAWGPGAAWLLARVPDLTGACRPGHRFEHGHPALLRAQRNHPHLRFGASRMLYHELLPVILAQRITAGEAVAQWHRLVRRLGDPAPGPWPELRTPPCPSRLASTPLWWFHPLGIEAKRAVALRDVARHAHRMWAWAQLPPGECATELALLRGIGEWTVGSVLGPALADEDAVAVGDYHLKNVVALALAGEPRGTDERMLELLAPYAGHRGRVIRLLLMDGHRARAFGPRQRILPMARW